jgi:hypothetical protein
MRRPNSSGLLLALASLVCRAGAFAAHGVALRGMAFRGAARAAPRRPRERAPPPQMGLVGLATEFSRVLLDFDRSNINEVQAWSGFVGGSFGVMGTLAVYEQKRLHAKERVNCAYCCGNGLLDCAQCLGTGFVTLTTETVGGAGGGAAVQRTVACPACKGRSMVECVNCYGTGLAIPETMTRKPDRRIDDEIEELLDEAGIAAVAFEVSQQQRAAALKSKEQRVLQDQLRMRAERDERAAERAAA